jgi:hypothetical protein
MSDVLDRIQDCRLLSKPVDTEKLLAIVARLTSGRK